MEMGTGPQLYQRVTAALPLLSTKLSPREPIQKLLFGEGVGNSRSAWPLQWGRCFPKLSNWSSPWVGNLGKAFAELQVILPFIL